MMMAAGTIACDSVRDEDAIVRNIIDMAKVARKQTSKKKKNAPGSRRRFVMKYNTRLNVQVFNTLYGKSTNIEATASAEG